MSQYFLIFLTIALVAINGFFVAAEFALVKVRPTRLERMAEAGKLFARTGLWLHARMDNALSACQLGITMASLALGWVGEPAIARLLEPLFHAAGITSEVAVHTISFIIAFSLITAAHLVLGEQAPKILALRRPEQLTRWCAAPLKAFYIVSLPLILGLTHSTSVLLKWFGVTGGSSHEGVHSEEEIRSLVSHAHTSGELTRAEQRLIHAVFDFDDTVTRQIMVPRGQVSFFDINGTMADALRVHKISRRTRYPVCDGSLDNIRGVVHLKDLVGPATNAEVDFAHIMRPPRYVPETMRVSQLLAHFQSAHQHLAFVVDEYGSLSGIVTLEDVLERIVGSVQDEFDIEIPDIRPDGPGRFIVSGGASLEAVRSTLGLEWYSDEVDTVSGFIMEKLGRVPVAGDRLRIDLGTAVVLATQGSRATEIRIETAVPEHDAPADHPDE